MPYLAELEQITVGCGHGVAISRPTLPTQGRYVSTPAETDENGIVAVPPPAPDPLPRLFAAVGLVALIGIGVTALFSKRNHRDIS